MLVKEKVPSFPVTEWTKSVCLNTLYVLAIPLTTLYILSLFNIDNNYHTYKVYIVKENDTLETICEKYNVDEAILKKYNNK